MPGGLYYAGYDDMPRGNGYSRRSYSRGGYQNDYSRGYDRGVGRQPKKRSGSKFMTDKSGNPCITGWNYSRSRGLISIIAGPYKGTKEVKSKSGKTWQNWFCKILFKDTGEIKKFSGLFNVGNSKLYIQELNMICNPKAPNGGYFGKHISRSYNR
jgi:hypothetical protein